MTAKKSSMGQGELALSERSGRYWPMLAKKKRKTTEHINRHSKESYIMSTATACLFLLSLFIPLVISILNIYTLLSPSISVTFHFFSCLLFFNAANLSISPSPLFCPSSCLCLAHGSFWALLQMRSPVSLPRFNNKHTHCVLACGFKQWWAW